MVLTSAVDSGAAPVVTDDAAAVCVKSTQLFCSALLMADFFGLGCRRSDENQFTTLGLADGRSPAPPPPGDENMSSAVMRVCVLCLLVVGRLDHVAPVLLTQLIKKRNATALARAHTRL